VPLRVCYRLPSSHPSYHQKENDLFIQRVQSRLAQALALQASTRTVRNNGGAALGSSIGSVRKRNEDCCLVARASYARGGRPSFTVAIVCDGLGGMLDGREAAILAASAFVSNLFCTYSSDPRERLQKAVAYANVEVFRRLNSGGGTTLSAVLLLPDQLGLLCHVGDSRVYGVSQDRSLQQLSRDDTLNALLKKRDSADVGSKDSRLVQFVGMGDEMEPQIAPIPNHSHSVLLTSDGAHDVPDPLFQRVVFEANGGVELIRNLIKLSEVLGGRDNASAVLLPVADDVNFQTAFDENELFVIMPDDTLSIYIAGSQLTERSSQLLHAGLAEPSSAPFESDEIVNPAQTPNANRQYAKAATTKPKARKPKGSSSPRRSPRSKNNDSERLPFDETKNEVDVKFSPSRGTPKGEQS
jgi:PPM family protein phosphatase